MKSNGTFSARAKSSKFNKKLKIKEINSAPRSPKKEVEKENFEEKIAINCSE